MHVKSPKRRALRSDDHQLLDVPGTKCETFGDRALASAAPQGRDTLGDKSLQQFSLCDTLNFMKIIVAAAEFCHRDQSHDKPV